MGNFNPNLLLFFLLDENWSFQFILKVGVSNVSWFHLFQDFFQDLDAGLFTFSKVVGLQFTEMFRDKLHIKAISYKSKKAM